MAEISVPRADLVLALDTTSEFGSLALAEGDRLIEEVPLHAPEGFGHLLFGEIERLLARHRLEWADLSGFGAAAGPGSFTGVRVGLAALKGLAEAADRPAIAVSNLQALASFGTRAMRAPVIDARRGDVFGAVYDSQLRLIQEEAVMKLADWIGSLPPGDVEIVSSGLELASSLPAVVNSAPRALASAVARIAAARLRSGLRQDPARIDANYVRRAEAEILWTNKSKNEI
jgi:tRNA threonylcarbamoyladenosine biosynthesis protein TsaB